MYNLIILLACMIPANCANCHNTLQNIDKYCNNCGQKTSVHRLSLHEVWHDAMHAFLHADKSIIQLTKNLALRPGTFAKEYIAGKRKKYFNPLSYLVITVAISAFVTGYFHLMEGGSGKSPVDNFIERNINLVFFAAVPISAMFSTLFFRKKGYNYAENLVINAFVSGFRIVFYLLIFTPLIIAFRHNFNAVLIIYMALWVGYLTWAHYEFYEEKLWIIIVKTIAQAALTQAVIFGLIWCGVTIYFRFFHQH